MKTNYKHVLAFVRSEFLFFFVIYIKLEVGVTGGLVNPTLAISSPPKTVTLVHSPMSEPDRSPLTVM